MIHVDTAFFPCELPPPPSFLALVKEFPQGENTWDLNVISSVLYNTDKLRLTTGETDFLKRARDKAHYHCDDVYI